MLERLIHWDQQLLLAVNGTHTPFWDVVMWNISWPIIWIPAYIVILYLCIRYYKMQTFYILLFTAVLISLTDTSSVYMFKNVVQRLRPTHEPALANLVYIVNDYRGGEFGFVSSHATNFFGIAVFFSMIFRRNLKYFALVSLSLAALIGYSRIYLGVHYPGDVICGALLGSLIGWVMGFFFCRFSRRLARRKQVPVEI